MSARKHVNARARIFGALASVLGFLGVGLGAFGAHALKGTLSSADLAIFETAVRYQMFHALALLAVALLEMREGPSGARGVAGGAFLAGAIVFSGSLYALVFTGIRGLGAVTPLGGVAFLAGWVALAWSFVERKEGAFPTANREGA